MTSPAADRRRVTRTVLFAAEFPPGGQQLVTNEYAYWNPAHTDATSSDVWEMTSGTLWARDGAGYSGGIDRTTPGPGSATFTDSAVFRLNTRRTDFADVEVAARVNVIRLGHTDATPAKPWDGIHLWLRYQNQQSLYVASVARRDGMVVIKKKTPGGDENGGTYHVLGREVFGHPIRLGEWRDVAATAVNQPDGAVRVTLLLDGRYVAGFTDRGVGGPPITAPGAVGLRADNTEFLFDHFRVLATAPTRTSQPE
jgi:hypothetical protein